MTLIVAEMSASHCGSLAKAIEIIHTAKRCGADAVKLQTFSPEGLCADPDYIIEKGPWAGDKLIDLYKCCHTPKSWHRQLFDLAKDIGITLFSTPFQPSDVDFLEALDCPMYKIASFEIIHLPLIEHANDRDWETE